jgi:hypothetical protein
LLWAYLVSVACFAGENKEFLGETMLNITLPHKFNIATPVDGSFILMKKMRTIPNLMKDGGAGV